MAPTNTSSETAPLSYGLAAIEPPIPMLILERDLKIRWISRAAIEEFGIEPEKLIGRSWYDLFPESRSRRPLHEEIFNGARQAAICPVCR